MQRVLRNTAATIGATFTVDNVGTDPVPDSATVTVAREDGTTLIASTAAIAGASGLFTYTLTPTHTAQLDVLKATWTATLSGYAQSLETFVEVVGGYLCTIADIDAQLSKGGTASDYTYTQKTAARTAATAAFETEAGVAFAPRYKRVKLDGVSGADALLPVPMVRSLTSVTQDDTALTVADLELYETGVVYNSAGWTSGRRNVEIKMEWGYQTPPPDVSRAIAILAASLLKDGPFDDRGYGVTDEGGAVRLLTAGISGASFSIPEVQAALDRHSFYAVG